jgi:hypothetical protein
MSKLIFPTHGGVLVPDQTRVVKTVRHRGRRGEYVVKLVDYSGGDASYYGRPYGYHYLDPSGGVTGGNSGNSNDVDEALRRAKKSIRDVETQPNTSQRKTDALRKKIEFFLRHAYPHDLKAATSLARAEKHAENVGWTVRWEPETEAYELGEGEEMPNEVLSASLVDSDGNVLASLGGIADPGRNYSRIVEAELALEAMGR